MIDQGYAILVDAMAAEHRLRRQAVREAQSAELWARRAELARNRALDDMAVGAQERADRHSRMEQLLLVRAAEIRCEIEELRAIVGTSRGVGRAPPDETDFEARFAKLEVEQEIERIRAAINARNPSGDQTNIRPTEDATKEEESQSWG